MFQKLHGLHSQLRNYSGLLINCLILILLAGQAQAAVLEHTSQQQVLEWLTTYKPAAMAGNKKLSFPAFMDELDQNRVIFVGEIHDRYDHHLTQLAILQALHHKNPRLAIGVEWFQQSFQPVINEFLAGKIDEKELLRRTEYFDRWRYDYRMLRPILEYAKANHLPVMALNAPSELTRKISKGGLQALTPQERAQLPTTINPPDEAYRSRLEKVFAQHANGQSQFDNFMLVQRVWDETMAQNINRFLQPNPDWRMIVFSGFGHIIHGDGIPKDMASHNPNLKIATVLSSDARDIQADMVNYFVLTDPLSLPPTGKLGVWLQPVDKGVKIGEMTEDSAAHKAGLQPGDRLVSLEGIHVTNMADLMLALGEHKPGQKVKIDIERQGKNGLLTKQVTLQ